MNYMKTLFFVDCSEIVKNKSKVTLWNDLFSPSKTKDIQFTIIQDKYSHLSGLNLWFMWQTCCYESHSWLVFCWLTVGLISSTENDSIDEPTMIMKRSSSPRTVTVFYCLVAARSQTAGWFSSTTCNKLPAERHRGREVMKAVCGAVGFRPESVRGETVNLWVWDKSVCVTERGCKCDWRCEDVKLWFRVWPLFGGFV